MELGDWVNTLVALIVGFGGALIGVRATKKQITADQGKERRDSVRASYDVLNMALDQLRSWATDAANSPLEAVPTADITQPWFLPPDPPPALPQEGRVSWSPEVRADVGQIERLTATLDRLSNIYSGLGPMGPVDNPNQTDQQRVARRAKEHAHDVHRDLERLIDSVQAQLPKEVRP